MKDSARRITGAIFGAAIGLFYGLVSQFVNVIILPDLPLYAPPPGRALTVVSAVLLGGLLGLIAAWPEEPIPGVIAGALVGALLSVIFFARSYVGYSEGMFKYLMTVIYTFLPRVFFFAPITALCRWALHWWETETINEPFSLRKRALSLLAILVAAAVGGLLSMHGSEARQALLSANELVQAGMQAPDEQSLPAVLKPVGGFLQGAYGDYSLEWNSNPDLLPVQRPIADYGIALQKLRRPRRCCKAIFISPLVAE